MDTANPYAQDPDVLYSWTVTGVAGGGSCGVTDSSTRARERVIESLDRAEGGKGFISVVEVDLLGMHPTYDRMRTVFSAVYDPKTRRVRVL